MRKSFWRRKPAVLILLAVAVFCIFGTAASARPVYGDFHFHEVGGINPLYAHQADWFDAASIAAVEEIPAAEPTVVHSVEEAAICVREGMVAREPSVSVTFRFDVGPGAAYENLEAYETWYNGEFMTWINGTGDTPPAAEIIREKALEHTGNPKEGDYLAYQYGSYHCSMGLDVQADYTDITLNYSFTYYTTAEQETNLDLLISMILSNLDTEGRDELSRIRILYDYICQNVVYDYEHLNDDNYTLKATAYAALVNKTAVCQGYANLFYRLALEVGLDARIIGGLGNGGPHAWNIVRLGDIYYNLDATWDSARYSTYGDSDHYLWYLRGKAFEDHVREAQFETDEFHSAYPMAESDFDGDVTYTYPASGERGTLITGVILGPATGYDGTAATGAASAFDGSPETYFDPMGRGSGYCGIDAGQPYILEKAAILSQIGGESRLKNAEIQGSNDGGSTWVTLWKSAEAAKESRRYTIVTEFENNTGYTMFRYFNADARGSVAELEFYGVRAVEEGEPEMILSLPSVDATIFDETFTVQIVLDQPAEFNSLMINDFEYDRSLFELVDGRWLISGSLSDFSLENSDAIITFGSTNKTLEGAVLELTFRNLTGISGDFDFGFSASAKRYTATGSEVYLRVECFGGTVSISKVLPGDVNGDAVLTSDDAIYLLRYTMNSTRYPINQPGDINGDGKVNSNDAFYLLRHIFRPEQYPLH